MKIEAGKIIKDCLRVYPDVYHDDRGEFFEGYHKRRYWETSDYLDRDFKQINFSESHRNVLRGLHYQTGEYVQSKLLTVLRGYIVDIVVDCRIGSPSFGMHEHYFLGSGKQIFIPAGCAHGFLSKKDGTLIMYQCDSYYNKESESGIRYDDPDLDIQWGVDRDDLIVSEKDLELPSWEDSYKFIL